MYAAIMQVRLLVILRVTWSRHENDTPCSKYSITWIGVLGTRTERLSGKRASILEQSAREEVSHFKPVPGTAFDKSSQTAEGTEHCAVGKADAFCSGASHRRASRCIAVDSSLVFCKENLIVFVGLIMSKRLAA